MNGYRFTIHGQRHRALDFVLQFAHIPSPVEMREQVDCRRRSSERSCDDAQKLARETARREKEYPPFARAKGEAELGSPLTYSKGLDEMHELPRPP